MSVHRHVCFYQAFVSRFVAFITYLLSRLTREVFHHLLCYSPVSLQGFFKADHGVHFFFITRLAVSFARSTVTFIRCSLFFLLVAFRRVDEPFML